MKKDLFHLPRTEHQHLRTLIPEMNLLEEKLEKITGKGKGTIPEMCLHLLHSGGKRLRPLLVVLSGKIINEKDTDMLITAGTAVELIHMASLVHDDIIDHSFFRRGNPTLNSLWGEKHAVLAGDFLFAKAFELLASIGKPTVLKLMVQAIQEMCTGEIDQLNQNFNIKQKETDYYDRINKKTAKLLAACCQAGAIIAGADQSTVLSLKKYGINLGYAFQITDDLLDLNGQSSIMGKPSGQDLSQGNLTLPVILLLHHPEHGDSVKNIISKKNLNSSDIRNIIILINDTGLLEEAYHAAKHCGLMAKNELAQLPQNTYRNILESLVDKALDRES